MPANFDGVAFAEQLYLAHPNKSDRNIAFQYLAEALAAGALPEQILAGHERWRRCAKWTDKKGRFAPKLSQWILDEGWKYPTPEEQEQPSEYSNEGL